MEEINTRPTKSVISANILATYTIWQSEKFSTYQAIPGIYAILISGKRKQVLKP